MTKTQTGLICVLLTVSVLFILMGIVICVYGIFASNRNLNKKKTMFAHSKLLFFSAFLIASVWCLRYSVSYYMLLLPAEAGTIQLSWGEELINSIIHTLQTFSLDADYSEYIQNGKEMMRFISNGSSGLVTAFGMYASVLNVMAPIAGGAIIFEILAGIFPRISLRLSYISVWKTKYFFSELNDSSLALARSICANGARFFKRPVIIFTDTYTDSEDEKASERLLEAKSIGAICLHDDLTHLRKNKYGSKIYFLIDKKESDNLQTLTDLVSDTSVKYLKHSEIYIFVQNDIYTHAEAQIRDKITQFLAEDEIPLILPVKSYRNLISNLLLDVPLYETLIHKKQKPDEYGRSKTIDLNITILGTGSIGTEMFMSAYWCGQILDCRLCINIVSNESMDSFMGRIDYINPDVIQSSKNGHQILLKNKKGEYSDPYFYINYYNSDITSYDLSGLLEQKTEQGHSLLDTDYFVVSLGSDEVNLSVADKLRQYIGNYHLSSDNEQKTVIAYVVYNSELCNTLNKCKRYDYSISGGADVYMHAFGSLEDVYSINNIFMLGPKIDADNADRSYNFDSGKEDRKNAYKKRRKDEYSYWSSIARSVHIKYKVFSSGLLDKSVFDFADDSEYADYVMKSKQKYALLVSEGRIKSPLIHRLAWLEHRRWNAFLRANGYRATQKYTEYSKKTNTYKYMGLKLHPCLVECDESGIKAELDEKGRIKRKSMFNDKYDESSFDMLDDVSYKVYELELTSEDFKAYDYPAEDIANLSVFSDEE